MLSNRLCQQAALRPRIAASIPLAAHLGLRTSQRSGWKSSRVFTSTAWQRKDDGRARTIQQEVSGKQLVAESVKPESVAKAKPAEPASKNDPLLAEQTVSNKEQRQADWAIIKDMAHYLWPKNDFQTRFRVGLSVGLLVGAKVGMTHCSILRCQKMLIESIGFERTNPVLLQKHRRLNEHRFRLNRRYGNDSGRCIDLRM